MGGATFTTLWHMKQTAATGARYDRFLRRDGPIGVLNEDEIRRAQRASYSETLKNGNDIALPPGFPAPQLALPEDGFAPDYFSTGFCAFCSQKLRDVLAQAAHVIQFTPVNLVWGGILAQTQNYTVMRVLAKQPAIDLWLSDCDVETYTYAESGEHVVRTGFMRRYVLLNDLTPLTEVFRIEESPTYILATDAVAERVVRARCTGIEFFDLQDNTPMDRPRRYRGPKGVVLR